MIDNRFHPLTVAEITPETADASVIRFDVPEAVRPRFAFLPGQHLTLRHDIGGEDVRRSYSLSAAPQEDAVKICVKRIAGGRFSTWANEALRPGDVVEAMEPHGSFIRHPSAPPGHIVGFAGGSGITPILSILKATLLGNPDSRFTLCYGNRDASGVMFLEELGALKNRFMQRLEVYHFLSAEAEDVHLFNGRMDRGKCDEILETLIDPAGIDAAYLCGPGGMMDAAEAALRAAGVAGDAIHAERFTADRSTADQEAFVAAMQTRAQGLQLSVTLDGRTRRIAFDAAAGNILDSARIAGLRAPFACKAGVCATCRARVTAGEVEMAARYGLSDDEVAAGYVLTCQAIPAGEGVAVDYDA
ncbi:MAG TPA: 2Fe-2S iron-sulfur cluster-binding protein [Sphingomonadaceae bacterium]|nr:2Fe-2S iron-sulfur cluster-binding protein [Sphingomonadaceae bacterium]